MAEQTYRIGEAADMLQLKSYVLRFWETEFAQLAPLRTDKGQRLYTESHLALLKRIKHLLHEQGMTIDGARRILTAEQRHGVAQTGGGAKHGSAARTALEAAPVPRAEAAENTPDSDVLRMLRDELLELRNMLLSQ